MSLGDVKPASLRKIETVIWKNLYLVARCQLTATEMMNRVLDNIVDPQELAGFHFDKVKFREFFKKKYDHMDHHTSFFFPGTVDCLSFLHRFLCHHLAFGALIKQEGRITTTQSSISALPSSNQQLPSTSHLFSFTNSQLFPLPAAAPFITMSQTPRRIEYLRTESGVNDRVAAGQRSGEGHDGDEVGQSRIADSQNAQKSTHIVERPLGLPLFGNVNSNALDNFFASIDPALFSHSSPRHQLAYSTFGDPPSGMFQQSSIAPVSPSTDPPNDSMASSELPPSTTGKDDVVDSNPASPTPSRSTPRRSLSPHSSPPSSPPVVASQEPQDSHPVYVQRPHIRLLPPKRPISPSDEDVIPSKRVKTLEGQTRRGKTRSGKTEHVKILEGKTRSAQKAIEEVPVESEDDMDINNTGNVPEDSDSVRRINDAGNVLSVKPSKPTRQIKTKAVSDKDGMNEHPEPPGIAEPSDNDLTDVPRLEVSGDKEVRFVRRS